jgi:DNA invertase Pin-like site-specific DNA recombinase
LRIGYARISTDDQSLNLQLDALRAAGCTRIYRDRVSGKSRNRPGLTRALTAIHEGDGIVVWRLDRLGRNFRDLVEIAEELRVRGSHLVSLSEGIDTSSHVGEVVYRVLCVFADFERRVIVERTVAGLAAAKRRGVRLGRKRKLGDEQVKEARRMMAVGMKAETVAAQLGVGRSTLYRYLRQYIK